MRGRINNKGSYKVKLVSISTPEEAQEALEAVIRIVMGSVPLNTFDESKKKRDNKIKQENTAKEYRSEK